MYLLVATHIYPKIAICHFDIYQRCPHRLSLSIDFLAIVLSAMCLISLNKATTSTMLRCQTKIPLSSVQWNFRRLLLLITTELCLLCVPGCIVRIRGMISRKWEGYQTPPELNKITTLHGKFFIKAWFDIGSKSQFTNLTK